MNARRLAAIWSGAGWLLNLAWEVSQSGLYAVPGASPRHWLYCLQASLVDLLVLVTLYLFMVAAASSWRWWQGGATRLAALAAAGFGVAALIEVLALTRGAWTYRDGMPLVPGLGVGWSPILQMTLIPLLLAPTSRRLAAGKGSP